MAGRAAGMMLALLLVGTEGSGAQPGDLAECLNMLSPRRIEACTAVIDNPVTDPMQRADALAARGLAHRRKGDLAAAIADYDAALAINPRFHVLHADEAKRTLLQLGGKL